MDSLVRRILDASSEDDRGAKMLEMLGEFHRGRPLDELLPLLRSEDAIAVDAGIWIASELGPSGRPLLQEVLPLLGHESREARFWAVDCVLQWAGDDGGALAATIPLLEDADAAVRWKALRFLSALSREQLVSAELHLASSGRAPRHASALAWLLGDRADDAAEVAARLRDPDALLRKYAAVAAARAVETNRALLVDARGCGDAELEQFAADQLARSIV